MGLQVRPGVRGLFDSVGSFVDSAASYAASSASSAADEDTGEGMTLDDGMFVSSDDGSAEDYATDETIGGFVGGLPGLSPIPTKIGEDADPITIGDELETLGSETVIAKARGRQLGYEHGYNGKPFSDANALFGPVAAAYEQGYAEGYVLGQQDKAAGKLVGGGGKVATPGGGGGGTPTQPQTFEEGMSTGTKVAYAGGAAVALVAAIAIYRKRKRAR